MSQYFEKLSINDVDGVIGYQEPNVAPAYTAPIPAAVFPSIIILLDVLLSALMKNFSLFSLLSFM